MTTSSSSRLLYSKMINTRTIVMTFVMLQLAVCRYSGVHGFFLAKPCSLIQRVAMGGETKIMSSQAFANVMVRGGTSSTANGKTSLSRDSQLYMSPQRSRGLESRRESATPTEGDMTLYLKAGPDGTSVGDCPFAHFVRLVLEEKNLPYELRPCVQDTKPQWLIDHYEGKMPALRHGKECYVESNVIAEYADFFFKDPPLKSKDKAATEAAEAAVDGFFPAVAKYLKNTVDENDPLLLESLKESLSKLESHLKTSGYDYLCGPEFSLLDCSLLPKLYHLIVGVEGYKNSKPNIMEDYPAIAAYYNRSAERPSFKATLYPKETVLWGWGNARS